MPHTARRGCLGPGHKLDLAFGALQRAKAPVDAVAGIAIDAPHTPLVKSLDKEIADGLGHGGRVPHREVWIEGAGGGLRRFQTITGRFAGFQAQWLNVHVDFPLLQRLALPITIGAVRYPGIKIHDPRVIRLLEVLLHGGSQVGGWTKQIHHAVFTTFHLSDSTYGLNQLRYDRRNETALSEPKQG